MGKLFVVKMIIYSVSLSTIFNNVTADPDMLQDVCVADLASDWEELLRRLMRPSVNSNPKQSGITINGFPCKATFVASDFFSSKLATPGIITPQNIMGSLVTTANVNQIPGLNTLGVSLARIDFAPGGMNPPHTHPRASEIIFVLMGQLDVWFITTANVVVFQTIKAGDVFVFPKGLIHFQKNNYGMPAAVISAFNSQLPGTQSIPFSLFASNPPLPGVVLAQAFQTSVMTVELIKARFNLVR